MNDVKKYLTKQFIDNLLNDEAFINYLIERLEQHPMFIYMFERHVHEHLRKFLINSSNLLPVTSRYFAGWDGHLKALERKENES